MFRLRAMALTVVLAATCWFVGTVCNAADSGIAVGIVDVGKVYAEAPRIKQMRETLQNRTLDLSKKLEIRSQNLMLTEEQVRELVDLRLKSAPTEADKAKIKQLSDIERANDEELKKLQATAQLDDKQKARLNELNDLQKKAKTIGEQMEQDYNSQLENERMDLEKKAVEEIEAVIKKIAEEKKLTYVFAKDAVFFGGTDFTSQVIEKLERKPQ